MRLTSRPGSNICLICFIYVHHTQYIYNDTLKKNKVHSFLQRWPGIEPGSGHVGFVVDKVHWDRYSLGTSFSSANHSTDCSTVITICQPGLVKWAKYLPTCQVDPSLIRTNLSFHLVKIRLSGSVVVKALCYKPQGRGSQTK
jgi:hypothetical protein